MVHNTPKIVYNVLRDWPSKNSAQNYLYQFYEFSSIQIKVKMHASFLTIIVDQLE